MRQADFDAFLADKSKHIDENITWAEDEDHSPTVEFRVEVLSDAGYPVFVRGSYNPLIDALTYAVIHRVSGRIYALDLGKDHHNPSCLYVGDKHKHRWNERVRDKEAYVPDDITAPANQPVEVWKQFCAEARIVHNGSMVPPPPIQWELDV